MTTKERLIRDIKDSLIDVNSILERQELSPTAINAIATMLNQANNYAQMLKGITEDAT